MKSFHEQLSTYAWDMVFTEGDTIKEKYVTLYERIDSIGFITRNGQDDIPYVICHKDLASIFCVFDGVKLRKNEKIITDFKYDNRDDTTFVGHIKTEGSYVKSGFDLYEDENAPNNQILICTKNHKAILYLFNLIL